MEWGSNVQSTCASKLDDLTDSQAGGTLQPLEPGRCPELSCRFESVVMKIMLPS